MGPLAGSFEEWATKSVGLGLHVKAEPRPLDGSFEKTCVVYRLLSLQGFEALGASLIWEEGCFERVWAVVQRIQGWPLGFPCRKVRTTWQSRAPKDHRKVRMLQTTNHDFWYCPDTGLWNQNVRSLCLFGVLGP